MKATTTTLHRLSPTIPKALPLPKHHHHHLLHKPSPSPNPSHPFSSTTLTPLQTLTASRILPYPRSALYALIADIPSYPSFLPYCKSSRITSYSASDPIHQTRWPRTADLRVGWGPYDEAFTSRIYCLPHTALEACAGSAEPTIPPSQLPHYYSSSSSSSSNDETSPAQREEKAPPPPPRADIQNSPLFTSLLTRWTLHEFPFKPSPPSSATTPPQEANAEAQPSHPRTEVNLVIEARFASAVYSALSQAAAPKVAGMMIGAFERRAREVLGEGHGGIVGEEGKKSWSKHH
ncbi:MAG: hypothetical protein Q9219_007091 [cf. Caloplaca sp. 3 TL-2023]